MEHKGYVYYDYDVEDQTIQSVQVLDDGSIVTLAECDSANTQGALFSKFDSYGQLDMSFGNQGHLFVHKPNGSSYNNWRDLGVLPDGSLMAVGRINTNGSGIHGGIIKVTPQGTLDTTFGTSGVLMLQSNGNSIYLVAIHTLSSGESIVLGKTTQQGTGVLYVAKIDEDGGLVSGFGGNGEVVIASTDAPWPRDIFVTPNNKLILTSQGYVSGYSHMSVTQLSGIGLLDQAFGTNGRADIQILNDHNYACKTMLLPDGKLLISGTTMGPWNDDFALARLNSDGSLDQSFHFDGMVTKNIGGGNDFVVDAALQSNGRAILVGNSADQSDNNISVTRFLTGYSTSVDVDEELLAALSLYPNPCSERFILQSELGQSLTINVYNLHGQLVMHETISTYSNIETMDWNAGLYTIMIKDDYDRTAVMKLQVMH